MGNLTDHFAAGGGDSSILEFIKFRADGRVITTLANGNVTTENPTSVLAATTTYQNLPGSSFSYIPPEGTKYVTFKCLSSYYHTDAANIAHYCIGLDSTNVDHTKMTWYKGTNYQGQWITEGTIEIDSSFTDSIADGRLSSWTTARSLSCRFREYNSSYEISVNDRYYIDGTGSSGEARVFKPIIEIIAHK